MRKEEQRALKVILWSIISLGILCFISLFLGRYTLKAGEVLEILWKQGSSNATNDPAVQTIWNIRLPRMLLAMIVGAGLAGAGTAFQGIFQNRLVSPDILGVSNGAGFGAALSMLLGAQSFFGISGMAFTGGILSVVITYSISKFKKDNAVLALVLSGIVVASFFNALISFIKLIADTESVLPSITYWLMGSFAGATNEKVFFAAVTVFIGLLVIFLMRWRINILSMGDEEAYTLGIDPVKNRFAVIAACTLITAACVTVTGIIGWIGMVMPNLCRDFVSANNKWLFPVACIFGAFFMLLMDIMARTLTAAEIPVGILTAIFGAPLFVMIYSKREESIH